MKIVTDDKTGLGQEKGSFVYVYFDEYGDPCNMCCVTGDDFKPNFLSEHSLIHINEDGSLDFEYTTRTPLDDVSEYEVGILSKNELEQLIKSLTSIYNLMEDDSSE